MFFIGIDPSLMGTAVVAVDGEGESHCEQLFSTKSTEDYVDRIIFLGSKVLEILKKYATNYPIYIEGIAYGAKGRSIAEMAALNYHIRILMREEMIPFKVIPATELKKFICGKGNAKKEQMLLQVYKKFGVEFKDNNLCDAYSLCRLALHDSTKDTPKRIVRRKL